MAICRCGCGSKVLFLRSYMSKRSVEFWAVARFGAAVNNDFLSRPIQDFSKPEIETFRQFLKQKTLSCLNHREKLHEYAQGRIDESDLPTRQQAWDDESQLIALAVSSADFLVRAGVIEKKELASRHKSKFTLLISNMKVLEKQLQTAEKENADLNKQVFLSD